METSSLQSPEATRQGSVAMQKFIFYWQFRSIRCIILPSSRCLCLISSDSFPRKGIHLGGRQLCDCQTLVSAAHGCSVVLHKARPAFAVPPALASGNPACSFPNGSTMGMCGMGEVQTTTPVPHVQLKCQYKGISSSACGALWPERSLLHSLLCLILL